MVTHITAPGEGATAELTLLVAEDRSRPLNPGEPIKFSTTLDGKPVSTRSSVPFYDSCRVLHLHGYAGRVRFVDATTHTVRMTMDIAKGARLTVIESPRGPVVVKFNPGKRNEDVTSGRNAEVLTIGKVEA